MNCINFLIYIDLTVSPGEDFFQYANGTWMKNNPLPAEYSRYGSFEIVREKNWEDLRSIFEDAAQSSDPPEGSNIKKIGDFYAIGMDSEKIEADGLQPLQEELNRIDAIQTSREVQEQIARMHSYGGAGFSGGLSPLFGFFSEQDQLNSQMVIAWLYQGGLGLPDRDYYVEESDREKEIRASYVEHVQKMFELMGEIPEEARKKSEVVMAIETRLATASMTRLEQRDPKAITNKLTLGENIADLGGLSVALDALEVALEKKPAKTIDGFTPAQRFFLSWAQVWRSNIREENLRLRLKTDVHSPAVARVNGLYKNMPEFYAAFDIKETDALYLPEDQRAKIW